MRILFVMRQPADARGLDAALRELHRRGYSIHLAYQEIKERSSYAALVALTEDCKRITASKLPRIKASRWTHLAHSLRLTADHLRYLEPPFEHAAKLRSDTAKRAPAIGRGLGRLAAAAGPRGVSSLRGLVQHLERSIVPPAQVQRLVAEHEPDVLLITPLVGFGSREADFLRAAKRQGVRTAFYVLSWDNLTTKGLLRDAPDLVLVWNELQADEAEQLHGVPRDRVRVTGAPSLDHWFDRRPRRTREEFCREVGLRADQPIVLYAGSHPWVIGGEAEVEFVLRWIAALRARGGVLADAGILIRPHPARNATHWARARLDDPQVVVWPPSPEHPFNESSRQNYFESIYYSSAVFGINTSAQIESAIVGRPVHTLLAEDLRRTQDALIHFNYLQADDFGLLHVAGSLGEHAAMLEASVRSERDDGRNERFVERFVRPFGRDVPATPAVVEAIGELAARPAPAPDQGPAFAHVQRLALEPLAALAAAGEARHKRGKAAKPSQEPQAVVRRLMRAAGERTVVAGPWLGDEIGELLYWIPFLRYAQTATLELRERLWVVTRSGSAVWYAGIGARHVLVEDVVEPTELAELAARFPDGDLRRLQVHFSDVLGADGFRFLPPDSVATIRARLLRNDPDDRRRLHRALDRVLEFAPLVPPELLDVYELPDDFVAVRFSDTELDRERAAEFVEALVSGGTVVVLEPPGLSDALAPLVALGRLRVLEDVNREAEASILSRARGFLGSYGPSPFVAALLGVPSVAVYTRRERVADEDLEIAASFLDREPFGRLQVLEATEMAEAAAGLLQDRTRSLSVA